MNITIYIDFRKCFVIGERLETIWGPSPIRGDLAKILASRKALIFDLEDAVGAAKEGYPRILALVEDTLEVRFGTMIGGKGRAKTGFDKVL